MLAEWVNAVANGVVLGSIIALAATGLTLIYGVLRVATFAHGDLLTLGGYIGFAFLGTWPWLGPVSGLGAALVIGTLFMMGRASKRSTGVVVGLAVLAAVPLGIYSAIATAMIVAAGVSILSERALWEPLKERGARMVMLMIASIGLALFLRGVIMLTWGGDIRTLDLGVPSIVRGPLGLALTMHQVTALVLALGGVIGVHLFLTRTTTGRMLRAIADNPDLAMVTGVDVPRLGRFTWALGGAMAAAAGVLYASVQTLAPETGWRLLLTLFAAVILGGIGSSEGTVLAALFLGIVQELSVVGTSALETSLDMDIPLVGPQYKLAVGFLILIITLLIRPQGLRGVELR